MHLLPFQSPKTNHQHLWAAQGKSIIAFAFYFFTFFSIRIPEKIDLYHIYIYTLTYTERQPLAQRVGQKTQALLGSTWGCAGLSQGTKRVVYQ